MPQIPEEKFRPTPCEVIIDLLKSVALEETALSHILNAEGERNQILVKKIECTYDKYEDLAESIKQTERVLNTIIMKEWLLLKKLDTAMDINQKLFCPIKKKCNCINFTE